MKITKIVVNNRKRAFILQVQNNIYEFAFSSLKLKPSRNNKIIKCEIDQDLSGEGFTYKLKNGKSDTILLDQVLYENQDPKLIREHILYNLSCSASAIIKTKKISKRSLARKLSISPTQLYRLLDQTFYGKTIDQMLKLLSALGHSIEMKIKKVA